MPKMEITTVGARNLSDTLTGFFIKDKRDENALKLSGFDQNNEDDVKRIKEFISYIVPNYNRKIISLDEESKTIELSIKKTDPYDYKRTVNMFTETDLSDKRKLIDNLKNLVYMIISQFDIPDDYNDLSIIQTFVDSVKKVNYENVRITDIDKRNELDHDRIDMIGCHRWYLSKVSSMTIIRDYKNLIKRSYEDYPDDVLSFEKIKKDFLIERLIGSFTDDVYLELMSMDDRIDSVFSLPLLHQYESLGFKGRTTAIDLYHRVSRILDSSRWIIFDDKIISQFDFELDADKIKHDMNAIMNCFVHDFFRSYDIDEKEIPKIRRYDDSESFVTAVSFGNVKHYFEIILTDDQKEYLKEGGDKDGLI